MLLTFGSGKEDAKPLMTGFLAPVSRSKSRVCKKSPYVKSIFISAKGLDV